MTASFKLTIDTVTHVGATINGGKGFTEKPTVTLELALDADAALVKIWGDINPLDPMNAGMGTIEADAEWLEASADWLVALTTNPALKELHVRVQDDVGNEATADASITLSGEGPPVPPVEPEQTHPKPLPASGGPEVVPEPERRHLVSIGSVVEIASSSLVAASRVMAPAAIDQISSMKSTMKIRRADRSQITTSVENSVVALTPTGRSQLSQPASSAAVERRDGEAFIASILDLGIL